MTTFPFFNAFERFLVFPKLMVGPSKIGSDPYAQFFCTIYIIGVRLGDGLKIGQSELGIIAQESVPALQYVSSVRKYGSKCR